MDKEIFTQLGTQFFEGGEEIKESCKDPLEGYIFRVQSDLRKRLKPFPERFAHGATLVIERRRPTE